MLTIPTLVDINSRLRSGFQALLGIAYLLVYSVIDPIVTVLSGQSFTFYLILGNIEQNVAPDTCDAEMLNRWGLIKLNRARTKAIPGDYECEITGVVGAVIPASTTFISDDTSTSPAYLFILDAAFTLTATTDTITLRALTAGTISKLEIGDTLTSTQPLLNVNSGAEVTAITTSPSDEEAVEDYRRKIIDSFRQNGGSWSATDYRLVGSQVAGVKQIYAYAISAIPNEVNLFIEGNTNGIPTSGTVITGVETAIEAVRPLIVKEVHYQACPILNVDIEITQIIGRTLTTSERALIFTALNNAIIAVRPFIAAADSESERNDSLSLNYSVSYSTVIQQVISSAIPGVPFGAVVMEVDSNVETYYQFDQGQIPFLNTITYA